ncbi:kielin/chordin-like protein isoform X2 [Argopecten irradians]|uniref:kielin/chordin-like protein isoform X2 n=1 Tax=Argopecten irradians TaxID=31199 RepID=UPI0037183AC1
MMLRVLFGVFLLVTVSAGVRGAIVSGGNIHDCPSPCIHDGVKYCGHLPCPRPPCPDPVTTPGDCCPHCPTGNATDHCPSPCTQGGHQYCHPIPCPFPPCSDPVTTPGECCPHCDSAVVGKRDDDHDCPHPCTQGGNKYCEPIPCPLPPCDNPVTTPGECCPHCPNRTECPHACKVDGILHCHSPACPPPEPCPKWVKTPGDCCYHCEGEDDVVIQKSAVKKSRDWPDPYRCYPPPPCPPPPPPPYCNATVIAPYDLCCEVCETACPNRCQWLGATWCNPPECLPLLCPNQTIAEGDCCPHCE